MHLGLRRTTGGFPWSGAAQWLPALDVGLVVKQDADEALAALRYARRAIVALGGATAALLAGDGVHLRPLPPPGRGERAPAALDPRQHLGGGGAEGPRTAPTSWRTRPGFACSSGPESQVLGRRDEDVLPFDAASRRQALERQVLESGRPVEATEDWTIEGAVRHFLTVVFPVRGEANEVTGLGVISTDITTQVESERRLEELSGNLERLVEERTAELAVSEERGRLILGAVIIAFVDS